MGKCSRQNKSLHSLTHRTIELDGSAPSSVGADAEISPEFALVLLRGRPGSRYELLMQSPPSGIGTVLLTSALLMSATFPLGLASAQRRSRVRAPEPTDATEAGAVSLEEAAIMLSSSSGDEVRSAVEALGIDGSPAAVDVLAARIRRGLPADLLDAAMETLAVVARPETTPLLMELLHHRRATVRAKAAAALAIARGPGTEQALAAALGDLDAQVRAAAAIALGQAGTAASSERLFLAFDRGVPEAAATIARIGSPADIDRLTQYLGRQAFSLVVEALREALHRSTTPERTKLEIIGRIGELATPEAKRFLTEYAATLTRREATLARAAREAAERIAQ